jgi:membrane AbrB-like protein
VNRLGVIATLAKTLAISAVGGAIFAWLGLPAAWMSGGMVAVAVTAIAGMRADVPSIAREVVFVILGSSLGTGVSPELIAQLPEWPLSLAGVLATVVAVHYGCQLYFRRICRWDAATAYFAAAPGVTTYILALALPTHADIRRIAVAQSGRVFLLVAFAPSLISAMEPATGQVTLHLASWRDIVLTLAAGAAGGLAMRALRVPAGGMLGAMGASALLHGLGFASGGFPPVLQTALLICVGGLIGSRFSGMTLRMLGDTVLAAVGGFVVAVSISALGAWATSFAVSQPFGQIALAFAPGGIDVMTAMAFALGLDSAFVAAHQLVRFLSISAYAPLFAREWAREAKRTDAMPPPVTAEED